MKYYRTRQLTATSDEVEDITRGMGEDGWRLGAIYALFLAQPDIFRLIFQKEEY